MERIERAKGEYYTAVCLGHYTDDTTILKAYIISF